MNPHNVLHGPGQHPKGIIVPNVVFGSEGDVLDIGQGFDPVAGNAGRTQTLMIKGHIIVAVIHHPFQPFQLHGLNLLAGHGFDFLIEIQRKHLQ